MYILISKKNNYCIRVVDCPVWQWHAVRATVTAAMCGSAAQSTYGCRTLTAGTHLTVQCQHAVSCMRCAISPCTRPSLKGLSAVALCALYVKWLITIIIITKINNTGAIGKKLVYKLISQTHKDLRTENWRKPNPRKPPTVDCTLKPGPEFRCKQSAGYLGHRVTV